MKHTTTNRQRVRWVPEMDSERNGLQTLLAFAYGLQLGRARRTALELQKFALQAQLASMASGAAIAVSSNGRIECIARAGEMAPELGSRPEAGLSGQCIRTGVSQICDDIEKDLVVDRIRSRTSGVRSVIYVPLFRGVQPAGVLGVFSDRPGHFTEHDLRVLYLLGREVTKFLKWEPNQVSGFPAVRDSSTTAATTEQQDSAKVTSGEMPVVTPVLPKAQETAGAAAHQPENNEASASVDTTVEISGTKNQRTTDQATVAGPGFEILDFTDASPFPRWATKAAITIAVFLTAAAVWWLLQSRRQNEYPMIYGPPQVTFDSPVPKLSPSPTPSVVEPVEPSGPTTAPSPVVTETALPLIETVRTQAMGGHTFVSIYLSAKSKFRAHALTQPDRIYVDFRGTRISPQLKKAKIDGAGSVKEFRFANSTATAARLVMVLDGPCTYLVSVTGTPNVVVFDIQPASQRQAAAEAAAPKI